MIPVSVIAVTRRRDELVEGLVARYAERLARLGTIDLVAVRPAEGRGVGADEARRVEAERLREAVARARPRGGGSRLVALDERGRSRDSLALARWLAGLPERGVSHVTFLVGGDEGLAPELVADCEETLSLSSMTLPHGLARVLLLEQIYRACAIEAGHPYHRA